MVLALKGFRTMMGVFTLGDARSFSGLTFDADVKKTTARHQCENRLKIVKTLKFEVGSNVKISQSRSLPPLTLDHQVLDPESWIYP